MSDGHQLEQFVAFVEETLVPKGFEVRLNRKEYDDAGNAMAEFDIEVRGKVGTGDIAWLIECRDRPSAGAAPGSWIEQLVGRRSRFKYSKVTAVSTSGFSPSAKQWARESGIELRELNSIDKNDFAWLEMDHLQFRQRLHNLRKATINIVQDGVSPEIIAEITEIVRAAKNDDPILINDAGMTATVGGVFFTVTHTLGIWDQMTKPGPPIRIRVLANFAEDDRYFIHSKHNKVAVGSIILEGELSIHDTLVAPETFKYEQSETGALISEIVKFPVVHEGQLAAIEIHKIAGEPEMKIIFRPSPKKA